MCIYTLLFWIVENSIKPLTSGETYLNILKKTSQTKKKLNKQWGSTDKYESAE